MKSLNCWFKSKDDKSTFQERIPVREKKQRRLSIRSEGLDFREHIQAHKKGKEREGIRTAAMISLIDIFNRGY